MFESQYPTASAGEIIALLSQWLSQSQATQATYSPASYSNGSYTFFWSKDSAKEQQIIDLTWNPQKKDFFGLVGLGLVYS